MNHSVDGLDDSGMDHTHMGHGGGGEGGDTCNVNMLFTWSTENLCLITRQWHIHSPGQLLFSLFVVAAIAAGYEALRAATRRYERHVDVRLGRIPKGSQVDLKKRAHVVKATLYAAQNFWAFMIMLLFMTYNGWVMIAVTAGCFVGYLVFAADNSNNNNAKLGSATKDTACH